MKTDYLQISPNSTVIVTLNNNIVCSDRDVYANRIIDKFKEALRDSTVKVMVIWDDVVKDIVVMSPTL